MRIWVDLTNTAHVLVLRPLVELLERDGHEVEITARPLSHTLELLDDWGHPYTTLGEYGGVSRVGKARAAAGRVVGMLRFGGGRRQAGGAPQGDAARQGPGRREGPGRGSGRRIRFDAAVAHGSTDLPMACRLLRIPNSTMFDYEWAALQHNVNCRLANRVLVPDAIPAERLRRYGARPPKLIRYPGLKEEYYMADFEPDATVLQHLGVDRELPLCVIRTAPSYALYLGGSETPLLPRVLRQVVEKEGAQAVVLARTPEQREDIRALGLERVIVPDRAVDGRSLVAFADALVSAGGTMNREAAVLGTPVWSIFEGRMGAVDEMLAREGRLRFLNDPAEIKVERKPAGKVEQRVRRDPRDLLELALPWVYPASG